jgi:hypothetical protein
MLDFSRKEAKGDKAILGRLVRGISDSIMDILTVTNMAAAHKNHQGPFRKCASGEFFVYPTDAHGANQADVGW